MNDLHKPVLLAEVMAGLALKDGGVYIDGTFGRGGYSRAMLEAGRTRVIGIDRDPEAIAAGQEMAKSYEGRLTLVQGAFGEMEDLARRHQLERVDGIALDLGVSSPQLDEAERGFSFQKDGPLDMRMGDEGPTAADLVNQSDEKELADIIFRFGEERYARRVARKIAEMRRETPFARTLQLAAAVRQVVPRSKDGIDPATRTFQAIRVAVNDELGELARGLDASTRLLAPGGRLAVVSFHSLEDRAVKDFLRAKSATSAGGSRYLPTKGEAVVPLFSLPVKKPIEASEEEVRSNPRARSAKLRLAERLGDSLLHKEYAA